MKRRAFLSLIVPAAAVLAGGCAFRPFHFIQMTDTQLGFNDGGKDGNTFTTETEMLEKVMSEINRMEPAPAFVTVCGDMTNAAGHKAQIAEYKRLVGLLHKDISCYPVSGNHDFKGKPTAENRALYAETYGPDRYTFERNGIGFIVLNSTLIHEAKDCPREAEAQWVWLKDALTAGSGPVKKPRIVFMHHPFFDHTIDEEDGYHAVPGESRKKYLDLFADNGVYTVFSGHRHTTIPENSYRGIRLINTNAVCKSFDNNPGLRVVRVLPDGLHHDFYSYDKLPGKVFLLNK
jgi:serine/threonine-protein phosphatase CPPED1